MVRSFVLGCVILSLQVTAQGQLNFDQPPISYESATPSNDVASLQSRLESGQIALPFTKEHGYLTALLKELNVPETSQVLVFSKTSFQRSKISPATPRALYFNDDVYLGWCQNGEVMEISTADPNLGAVFYTIDQTAAEHPQILRQTDTCTQCHASSLTQGIPGHLVRSIYPDRSGMPLLAAGSFRTSHQSPFKERWGGWYVTGTHGEMTHMGNTLAATKQPRDVDFSAGQNVTSLKPLFAVGPYLSPHSDIVALMVLEHQSLAHNLITLANYEGRLALRDETVLREMSHQENAERPNSISRRMDAAAERLLKYMLFVDEAQLTSPVHGTSDFAKEFTARGPFDSHGRSLRDFDLQTRMFKYPLSYLVYSKAFDSLPDDVRDRFYQRLWEVLSGENDSQDYAHLSPEIRTAIREILIATKPGLPSYWARPKG